ncbi:concanavalin A-like lectin/glucanase domain-containing protein [Russula emetica]|nr:concanavalin A-like lectin/glucanase domain-containing protein [Russula emetica]
MHVGFASIAALSLSLRVALCDYCTNFTLSNTWVGNDFLSNDWDWFTLPDPTNGRVNYVSQAEALQEGLTYVNGSVFFMRADDTNIVGNDSTTPGRNSIRITSQESWDDAIYVLDIGHMPEGCSTWPAFWTKSATSLWPAGGEIDIIEGCNLVTVNRATLHTSPGCLMSPDSQSTQTGTTLTSDCDAAANGCSVNFNEASTPASYGSEFNNEGGGFYVMSNTQASGIQIWYWERSSQSIPPEIILGNSLNPNDGWGTPAANFSMVPGYCDYSEYFNAQQIIFDLTFCGDFAGLTWDQSSCASLSPTCSDYVDNNPSAFSTAFWAINRLSVYVPS